MTGSTVTQRESFAKELKIGRGYQWRWIAIMFIWWSGFLAGGVTISVVEISELSDNSTALLITDVLFITFSIIFLTIGVVAFDRYKRHGAK